MLLSCNTQLGKFYWIIAQ